MLEKNSLFSFHPSLSLTSLVYENPFISAFAAILVFSTLYRTYTWVSSAPPPRRQHLHLLLREAHGAIRKSDKILRQYEKTISSMLSSSSPIPIIEWKRMENSLQQALLALDTIQKHGILEQHAQKFPAESHEALFNSFSKREKKKFEYHFDQLKQKRKALVDRYLKTLVTIDSKLSSLEVDTSK